MQHQVIEPFSVHTPVASVWLLEKQCHPAAAQPSMRHPRHQVIEPFFSSTLIISVVTQSKDFIMRMHRRSWQWPGKIKEETSLLKSTRSNRWPCAWKSHSSLSETERLDAASGNRTILSPHYVASEWLLEKTVSSRRRASTQQNACDTHDIRSSNHSSHPHSASAWLLEAKTSTCGCTDVLGTGPAR